MTERKRACEVLTTLIIAIISLISSIAYYVVIFRVGIYFVKELIALNANISTLGIIINVCLFFLMTYSASKITTICHELGHLFFGLIAGFNFQEICFNPLSFVKNGKKINIKLEKTERGLAGSCSMLAEPNKKYNKTLLMLFALGGIITELIFVIVCVIFISHVSNLYMFVFFTLIIVFSTFGIIENSLPKFSESGAASDMLLLFNIIKNPQSLINLMNAIEIMKKIDKYSLVEEFEIDCPKSFYTVGDIQLGLCYVMFFVDNQQYEKAKKIIDCILSEGGNNLFKNNKMYLLLYNIVCAVETDSSNEYIATLYTPEVQTFIKKQSKNNPDFESFENIYKEAAKEHPD